MCGHDGEKRKNCGRDDDVESSNNKTKRSNKIKSVLLRLTQKIKSPDPRLFKLFRLELNEAEREEHD